MVGITLAQELNNFVLYMNEQGILDHNFEQICRLQNDQNPLFVTEVIYLYWRDAEQAIAEVHNLLVEPTTDYDKLTSAIHQLRLASASIGGCSVALRCCELHLACDDHDKARCCYLFQKVVDEYRTLRQNLGHIIDLERKVLAYERRHHH